MKHMISLSMLMLLSFSAFAKESCSIMMDMDHLELTDVEKSKIELYLKKKDFSLNKFSQYGFFMNTNSYYIDALKLDKDASGNHQMEVLRPQAPSLENKQVFGMTYTYSVPQAPKYEKIEKNKFELVLRKLSFGGGEPMKVLKPKNRLFGLLKDQGSDGYVALHSILRDLPKCGKDELAQNDSDRSMERQMMSGYGIQGTLTSPSFGAFMR